ncbi:MAG: AsmA family protein [Methylococcales bacterium]
MNRLLKILLSIVALVVTLIVAAIVILPLLITPNDFKPEIQAAVKDATGRDITIEGDLELSVFPWLGISTGKITLSNAQGFSAKNFAEIEESNVKVKLLPLLSKELEVSRIVLKGLVLNLAKNKKGVTNWDDLVKKDSSTSPADKDDKSKATSPSPLAALAVGGISIEHANISWDDQQQGKFTEVTDFNFTSGSLAFDQAINIALSLTVVNKEPAISESINFSTDLFINKQLDNFKLSGFNLESVTKGKDIPGESIKVNLLADIAIDLTQQILNISDLKLSTGELMLTANIKGTQIKDKPSFSGPIKINQFNLAKLMQKMSITLPEMQDSTALNKLSVSFMLQATADSVDINNLLIKLDETTIEGSTQIINFAKPAIKFNINIDDIDVDRYLAKKQAGTKTSTVTPASAAAASAGLLPIKTLKELNANGEINIVKLKINQLKMQGIKLKLNAKQGVIKTQQSIKQLYQGTYKGSTTINVRNRTPSIALNERLNKVNINPLLTDLQNEARISGIVNANATLQGYGNSAKAIKSSLSGNIAFNFNNGVIKGFNLQKIIDNSKALLKGAALPTDNKNDQTVFSVIKGTAKIRQGLVTNNDLYMEASKLRVNGEGTANLATDKLDYRIEAKLLKKVATATEAEKIKGMPIIIKVGGGIAKPTYTLDIASMLLEKNKDKINKKTDELLKKLDDKVGPGVGKLLRGFF